MSTEQAEKKNYKQTLNLPQTGFAMEAKLTTNEPIRLAKWQAMGLYQKTLDARKDQPLWVLHDGPPFANGDIHLGHVVNKTLKDVFIRAKTMAGFLTPYVPGWDCHGLPIEHKIQQELGPKLREMSTVEVRQKCYAYAEKYVSVQAKQFQRLGILGDWENPYLTMVPAYESRTLEVFARFVEAGLVYKQLKPVHWSIANQTALADAELEYKDKEDTSVFVEFPLANPGAAKAQFDLRVNAKLSLLIWTTTPWTLPANLAVAVHPDVKYAFVKYKRNQDWHLAVVGEDLVGKVFGGDRGTKAGVSEMETVKTVLGKELVGLEYSHPFIGRTGKVLPADYVTTTDGTGLVHTAPGHGEEDYATGMAAGLDVYCPVQANGRFDTTAPDFLQGKTVWEGNPLVVEKLKEVDLLFADEKILHSYPHDWRSKTPTIFRATEQWFVALDKPYQSKHDPEGLRPETLRDRALLSVGLNPHAPVTAEQQREVREWQNDSHDAWVEGEAAREAGTPQKKLSREEIASFDEKHGPEFEWIAKSSVSEFIPAWGQNRMRAMLENRPDWCVSRQRAWGLPIPVFYNEAGKALLTPASVRAVAKRFAEKGSDAWFNDTPAELLGDFDPGPEFPKDKLRKEKDIFDVWFESGSSWHSVLEARPQLKFPADLYLEGSDQHRGWFQLSLLPSLGATGVPPFKSVLTHGFIVKPDGTKVSKSDKEYVTATQEIDRHGADLLRLWTCSVDYQGDMPCSPQVLKEFSDKYRKIRNTLRYLLSNLYDYAPQGELVVPQNSLDGWALHQLDVLITDVRAAYNEYQLHKAFRLLHDFCSVQLSSVYGNAMKDRLYCEAADGPLRRRSQFVMHKMAIALTKMLAPMVVYTADEAWEQIPHKPAGDAGLESVHLALMPEPSGQVVSDDQQAEWKMLMELRDAALLQLDGLKKEVALNKALDAEVIYRIDDETTRRRLAAYGVDLEDMVGAGSHSIVEKSVEGPAVTVQVLDRRTTEGYASCARSWKRRRDVGADPELPDLSLRDALAVKKSRA